MRHENNINLFNLLGDLLGNESTSRYTPINNKIHVDLPHRFHHKLCAEEILPLRMNHKPIRGCKNPKAQSSRMTIKGKLQLKAEIN